MIVFASASGICESLMSKIMGSLKQPAITKHPKGTASFYLRVKAEDGSMWEACTEKALPIAEIIASLENEYLGYMRSMLLKQPGCDCPEEVTLGGTCPVHKLSV